MWHWEGRRGDGRASRGGSDEPFPRKKRPNPAQENACARAQSGHSGTPETAQCTRGGKARRRVGAHPPAGKCSTGGRAHLHSRVRKEEVDHRVVQVLHRVETAQKKTTQKVPSRLRLEVVPL